jgi:hypothetical protein
VQVKCFKIKYLLTELWTLDAYAQNNYLKSAIEVKFTAVLKTLSTFENKLDIWPPDASK